MMKTFSNEQMNNVMTADMKRFCALKEIIELTQSDSHGNTNNLIDILNKIKQTAKDATK